MYIHKNEIETQMYISIQVIMGFDTHTVFILFGVKIPDCDISDIINIFYPGLDEGDLKRTLLIPDTTYRIISNGGYFISLKSIRFNVGDDDVPYEGPTKIVPPSQEEVDQFNTFLIQHGIPYPYGQYFLP
jgi:hypothetical protein